MADATVSWRGDAWLAALERRVEANMHDAAAFLADGAAARAPRRTGLLADEIGYQVERRGGQIVARIGVRGVGNRGDAFYGYFQELGTSKMAANPFLRPTLAIDAPAAARILLRR